MSGHRKYEPFDNFIVTEIVRSLPDFDVARLQDAVADIIDSQMGGLHSNADALVAFNLFGARLMLAFDGDELVYDRGGSDPSRPFGVLTVMSESEMDA